MVQIGCSASDRLRVPARPAQHVHRRVPEMRRGITVSAVGLGCMGMSLAYGYVSRGDPNQLAQGNVAASMKEIPTGTRANV